MRHLFLMSLIVFAVTPAMAQSYAEQQYQPQTSYPQQEASVSGYAAQPVYPQPAYTPPPQPVQQPAHVQPQPTDAGQSVVTDIRQMNF